MSGRHPLLSRVVGEDETLTCEVKFPHLDEPEAFTFRRVRGAETLQLKRMRQVDGIRMLKDIRKGGGDIGALRDGLSSLDGGEDRTVELALQFGDALEGSSERAERLAAKCIALSLDPGVDDEGRAYQPLSDEQALDLLAVTGGVEGKLARTAMDACGLLEVGEDDEPEAVDLPA